MYKKHFLLLLSFSATIFSGMHSRCCLAAQLDAASQSALQNTQEMLTDPALREKAVQETEAARAADQQAKSVAGSPENTEALYRISGTVMSEITHRTGGDPAKMNELLKDAEKNPEAFGESLTPESQSAIRDLAGKVPAKQ
jgi:hypothetical protein